MSQQPRVAIIGGGPAGLTTGYVLTKDSKAIVTVFERDPRYLGGLSRTARHGDYHFDIGGHRFFSKAKEIEDLWAEILPDDFLVRPRSSRIYYGGNFFAYPLKPFDALLKLGVLESTRCVLSYLKRRLFPHPDPKNFSEWVSNQFGDRLFGIFFRTYTEKVWGMRCEEISSDWAAQRIKGLSLGGAIRNAIFGSGGKAQVKSLIESFRYPRKGPGMMWEACGARIRERGGTIQMGQRVSGLSWDPGAAEWTLRVEGPEGERRIGGFDHVVSSAPLRELARDLAPTLAKETLASAAALRYRDFLTVVLIMEDRKVFDDNWIYIHSPEVRVGRIQNFKSWSPEMVPDPSRACFGLEYFCFENDELWNRSDAELLALAAKEFEQVGLGRASDVLDGCVVRQAKAYPVYDDAYQQNVDRLRTELEARFPTLHLAGRNGMHKYNNQDHAMMTGILSARNILAGTRAFDVWKVNQDAEYHEQASVKTAGGGASGLRLTPTRVDPR